ncbi:hypothetical protein V7O62_12290 [Methanolobus sp. ZRKC2]|uniref:hypothetical protein n=1 Tax=Methanolobus sp. ZRKC2 TaxID=3125783 RepID=UPI00324D5940
MSDFIILIQFIASVVGAAFDAFDTVFMDGYTFLDIFLALAYFGSILWFYEELTDIRGGRND